MILGAHYDTVPGSPGANDNASGVAMMLELARSFSPQFGAGAPGRTLRFIAFVNEEPPYFQSPTMGSLVYARLCRERGENIAAMISIDGIGYYDRTPGSQHYPFPFSMIYPDTADFAGFLANTASRRLVRQAIGTFREHAGFPSEGAAVPGVIEGVGWSDHWSFWQAGYPAILLTDTLPFRYDHYHLATDTVDRLNYGAMARIAAGMIHVLADLTQTR